MNYLRDIMSICIELHKKNYIFTAPILKCKSNDELLNILNRLTCLKRTIEKYDNDIISVSKNYEKDKVKLDEKHENEKTLLENKIKELYEKLDEMQKLEKINLENEHEKQIQDIEDLKTSISEEIQKINSDFINMNKQTEENILLEDEYEKLCSQNID